MVPRSVPMLGLGALSLLCATPALAQTPPAPAPPPSSGPVFRVQQDTPAPQPTPAPPPRETVRLEYVAAPGCPDQQAMRTILASRLGYDPVAPGAERLLRVALTRGGAGFSAQAELRDRTGRVVWSRPPLADPDCRALVDVIGLSAKFAIDPALAAAPPPAPGPAPSPSPAPLLAPPPPPQPGRPDSASPAPFSRPKVRLGMRGAGAIGTAPGPTGTISADVGLGWPHFSIAVEGRGDVPVTGAVDAAVQLRTRVAAGSLVPCGHYGWFVGCGLISVGGLWAEGVNTRSPAMASAVYAVAGVRAGLEWPIPSFSSLALRLSLDVLGTVHPIIARVDGAHVWAAPPFAGLLGGGFVLKI